VIGKAEGEKLTATQKLEQKEIIIIIIIIIKRGSKDTIGLRQNNFPLK
jgi:hypothetical protein